jgi:hypothetical protein
MDWHYGSSRTASALQAQSPEFKPQSHPQKKKENTGTGEVAHAYNPSYTEGRDQEDGDSTQAKS